ncbi:hypothetical protein A6302_01948 [Methylobrevis pamukkalensis]|uniref:Uncharacterized protein n=1 Tax=Methylobrevis pamukkalensis TaxID=1439726 RepID=A0A1E3H321_9HYPH|nr:hypothetical protein A6302_01948 [Methylobrevis pamukkalensis]
MASQPNVLNRFCRGAGTAVVAVALLAGATLGPAHAQQGPASVADLAEG